MHFLNPLYLLGLALASIPILIHLLIIRKNKTIEFSSLRFLKELQKTQIRRLKLKQLLLLILRTLIIVFLILSFSRPVVRSDFPIFRNYSNISTVIILDNSISMDVSDEFGNRLRQGKGFVTSLLDNLREGDQVALIHTTDITSNGAFTSDFQFIKDELARTNVSLVISSYENSLRLAQKILSKSKNFSKEVFLISDFQKSALRNFTDSVRLFDSQTSLNLVQVGGKSRFQIENVSIDSVVPLTRIFEQNKFVEFEVYLSNSSNKNLDNLVLSLFMNGERSAQRLFNLQAKGHQKVVIGGNVKSKGIVRCLFEIESDALEYDNKRWFGFIVPDKITVGLVSDNESGYIHKFLKSLEGENIQSKLILPNQVGVSNLSDVSVLIIENPNLDNGSYQKIRDYLKSGKGLLLFPPISGNDLPLKNLFSSIGISLNFESKGFGANNSPTFNFIDLEHPLFFNVFAPTSDKSIVIPDPPKISNLLTTSSGLALIQTSAGQFLTEFNFEGSKILYCSVAPDLKWGNFVLTSLFPVLIYRSIFYLNSFNEYNFSLVCGEPLSLTFPKGITPTNLFRVEDPLGNTTEMQAVQLPSGNLLELRNLLLIGTYGLKNGDDVTIGTVSVNVDAKESLLDLAEKEQIISYIRKHLHKDVKVNFIDDLKSFHSADFREYAGTELWKLFLILAIISAILEMIVARTSRREMEN